MKRDKGFFLFYQTNVNFVRKIEIMIDPNVDLVVKLQEKVDQLIDRYNGLKAEVEMVQGENERLTEQLDKSARAYEELEGRYNNLKLSIGLVTGEYETGETKKRINQIVREIDKCIALLNR
ncbi:cell division protein ZapB [Marinilabiliaceae bacterium JC017]|nr:cell division protein ZapB [Marinilabiliaceae bacterium JC017]